jgi:hypothetical protein
MGGGGGFGGGMTVQDKILEENRKQTGHLARLDGSAGQAIHILGAPQVDHSLTDPFMDRDKKGIEHHMDRGKMEKFGTMPVFGNPLGPQTSHVRGAFGGNHAGSTQHADSLSTISGHLSSILAWCQSQAFGKGSATAGSLVTRA